MVRVQILNVTVPSVFQDPGGVFLDLGQTDLSLSRVAEELNEINEIKFGGVRQFEIPMSGKNLTVFGPEWTSATPHDFDWEPLECRIYVGASCLEETKIGVVDTHEGRNTMTVVAARATDYWLIGAKGLRLPQIPYDDFEFGKEIIDDSRANGYGYTDGDLGIAFPPMFVGRPLEPSKMTVEYMRWTYHLLPLFRRGFAEFGWCFECPALETTLGRQIQAYLIDENAYDNAALLEANKATLQTGEFDRDEDYKIDGGIFSPNPNRWAYYWEQIFTSVYDPGSNLIGGRYTGVGHFRIEITMQYIPSQIRINEFEAIVFRVSPNNREEIYKSAFVFPDVDAQGFDNTQQYEYSWNLEITLAVNQHIEIWFYAESYFKTLNIENIVVKIEPTTVYPQRGEMINPAAYLRNDPLLDPLKGWVHAMRGKLDIIPGEKRVVVMPNYETDFWGDTMDGYYRDTLIDLTTVQVNNSSQVVTPNTKPKRYQLIRWKETKDAYIKDQGFDKLEPVFSKTVDLGSHFVPEYNEIKNPYFEPTMNDWVYEFSPIGYEHLPVNLPMMLDHIPEGDDYKALSSEIGPRLLFCSEPRSQSFGADAGLTQVFINWEGTSLGTWNHLYMRSPFVTDAEQPNLVFKDPLDVITNNLFNTFWRVWIYGTIMTTEINILARIQGGAFFGFSFRDAYKVDVRGKSVICNLLSLNDFSPTTGLSTPMTLQPRGAGGVVSDNTTIDPCDGYTYELQITEAGGTYTFTEVTDNPDAGTIEWRYEGSTMWTTAGSLPNPTGPFYVRLTAGGDCTTSTVVKYVDPCGNVPVILIDYEVDESGQDCVTATIGGILNDTINSTDLEYDLDMAGAWAAYTPGTPICGTYTQICFRGSIEWTGTCEDYTLDEQCFEIPPDTDCNQNFPEITIIHAGLDSFNFDIGGSYESEIGSFHFFYKHDGEPDSDAKRWTDQNPIVGTDYLVRLHIFWCDDCPAYCSAWVPVEDPMALAAALTSGMEWDFGKIPEDRKPEIRDLIARGDRAKLARIHNELQLSDHEYCCGPELGHVMNWFWHGLNNGLI